MGAMLADRVDDEGDDCSLEETVETKDTKPSTGGVLGGLFGGSDDEGEPKPKILTHPREIAKRTTYLRMMITID